MPFTIQEFTSELNKRGVVKSSDFSVIVLPPAEMAANEPEWLSLRVESVNLPPRTVMTIEQRYHGPVRYMPYSVIFTPITLNVLCGEDMKERDFFMRWQEFVSMQYKGDIEGGIGRKGKGGGQQSPGKYDSNYYDETIKEGSIEIQLYPGSAEGGDQGTLGAAMGIASSFGFNPSIITSPLGFNIPGLSKPAAKPPKPSMKIKLNECYPRTISEVGLNWANGEELVKLQVEMMYYDFTEEYLKTPAAAGEPGGLGGLAGNIRKGVNLMNKFKPLISGVRNGGLKNAVVGGAGGSFTSASANIKI